jgi:hypothetical protein
MYFKFDKKNDMASYLSFSYLTMEKILQKLDTIMKDDYVSSPFPVLFQKVESLIKKSMNNHQFSLPIQVPKNLKFTNT